MTLLRYLLAAVCLGTVTLPTVAAPVAYSFSGVVDSDDANRGWAAFTGSFSFDSATPDGIVDASTAAYAHAGTPWGMSISFEGLPAITLDGSFNLLVSNDLSGSDQLGALARSADGTQSFSLALFDFSAALFASDALPLPAGGLTLADFGWSSFAYEVSGESYLQGRLTALNCSLGCGVSDALPPSSVPEPSSLSLLTLALVLGVRRRTPTTMA